jgi:hypothetical protein
VVLRGLQKYFEEASMKLLRAVMFALATCGTGSVAVAQHDPPPVQALALLVADARDEEEVAQHDPPPVQAL